MHKILLSVCLMAGGAACADPCTDEIAALYDGGALDAFAQPPHRIETTTRLADGTVQYEYLTFFDSPLKSMNGVKGRGLFTLGIGADTWTGPTPDGPWTKMPNQMPVDMEAFRRDMQEQFARNLTKTDCPGLVDSEDGPVRVYRYTSQTDKNEAQGGTYFGGSYTDFIDPDSGRLIRREETGSFAHYSPQPGTNVTVSRYIYDDPRRLTVPD